MATAGADEGGRGGGGGGGTSSSAGELLPVVCMHWAEAQAHCAYRWEREMEMMLDLTRGRSRCVGAAAHIEDQLLRLLLDERRQWAEKALHAAKGSTRTDDMHFESYFYSEVDFGLPEQAHARRDPNRLTYAQHGLTDFDASRVTAALRDRYTPREICEVVRRKVLEPSTAIPAAGELREKLVDWLGAHIPAGMLPDRPTDERRATWLHTYCHDEAYRMTEPALRFALCGMRILKVEWPSAHAAAPRPDGRPPNGERSGGGGRAGAGAVPAAATVRIVDGPPQPDARRHQAGVHPAPPPPPGVGAGSSAGWVLACAVLVVAIAPGLLLRAGWLPAFE